MPSAIAVPDIRPISELRTNLNGICEDARDTQEPIFMTKNRKPALVIIDCKAYERQRQHDRYVPKLREAEIEASYPPPPPEPDSPPHRTAHLANIFKTWGL